MNRNSSTLALLLSLCSANLWAEVEIPANWHQVEVIVFAQQDPGGQEGFAVDPVLSYPERLQLLHTGDQLNPPLRPGASHNETLAALMVPERFLKRETAQQPVSYVPLEKALRKLDPETYTLEKSSGYRVLFHSAWQQPVESAQNARPVFINGGANFDQHRELEGSLKISKSRFYHLDVNLWLAKFAPAVSAVPPPQPTAEATVGTTAQTVPETTAPPVQQPIIRLPEPPNSSDSRELLRLNMIDNLNKPIGDSNDVAAQQQVSYSATAVDLLKDSQQIGLNSLIYLDHPRMGVLIMVSPLVEEEASETPPAAGMVNPAQD